MKLGFDPKRPIYLVFWKDAQLMAAGWIPFDEPSPLSITLTVGFLLRRTKDTIEVAQSATVDGDFDSNFIIPRHAIVKMLRLVNKRRVRRDRSKRR